MSIFVFTEILYNPFCNTWQVPILNHRGQRHYCCTSRMYTWHVTTTPLLCSPCENEIRVEEVQHNFILYDLGLSIKDNTPDKRLDLNGRVLQTVPLQRWMLHLKTCMFFIARTCGMDCWTCTPHVFVRTTRHRVPNKNKYNFQFKIKKKNK